ncbi:hypothetical protein [Aquisphaera insulae]|uniref:hypothetical protein n=1 Tax=Aquisphaera insulae TaxID=2712864 RepID=UPI0013E9D785|nr:hypothetical protein [Aquisphaera insulae]
MRGGAPRKPAGEAAARAALLAFCKLPWRFIPFPADALQLEPIEVIFPVALPFLFAYTKRNRIDRRIGELSYPVYLVHWLVIDLLRMSGSPWVQRNLGALTGLLTLASAIVIWYAVDRPIDAWRQQLAARATGQLPAGQGADTVPASTGG